MYGLVREALQQDEKPRSPLRTCDVLVSLLLKLSGHKVPIVTQQKCIAWSYKGQVLCSSLIESMKLGKDPCLQFVCVPGVLCRQDKATGLALLTVKGEINPKFSSHGDTVTVPSSQVKDLSAFNAIDHTWKYHVEGDCMLIHLAAKVAVDTYTRVNPFAIIEQCARTLITPACSHPFDQLDGGVTQDYVFVHPKCFLLNDTSGGGEVIMVYAVRGNDPLRMMILGTLREMENASLVVVGGDACLSCSLDLCRRAGACYLVA